MPHIPGVKLRFKMDWKDWAMMLAFVGYLALAEALALWVCHLSGVL